jgi:YD repeat-containing protein
MTAAGRATSRSRRVTTTSWITKGNTQYGNATRIEDYSDAGTTLYRTIERWYYPHAADGAYYQAHLPAQEIVWAGVVGTTCARQTRYVYDTTGQAAWQTAPTQGLLREVWQAGYGGVGCNAGWLRTTAAAYDAWGNRTQESDANGQTTTTVYNSHLHAYPLSVTIQPGTANGGSGGATLTTSYKYYGINAEAGGLGWFGQLQSTTDPNGAITSYDYDGFGRVTGIRRPVVNPTDYTPPCSGFTCAATEVYAYADAPAPFTIYHAVRKDTQPDSVATASYRQDWTFYDGLGQVIQTQAEGATPAQGVLVSTRYNALGLVVSQTVPYFGTASGVYQPLSAWAGKTSTTTYDALGRATRVTQPDGSWVDMVYNGRQTAVVDALRHQTLREVDAFGRLVSVKQYTNIATPPNWSAPVAFQATYTYNVRDQLEQVIGSDGAVTDPAYDLLGRKVSLSDADMGAWQYRYDAAGNLVKQRDARNQAICFYYDGHHRLIGKTYHAGVSNLDALTCSGAYTISYGYDAGANGLGRRTSMAAGSGSTSWSYDARGRLTSESKIIGANTFVTGHSYRSDDASATLTYPDGEVLTYGYDARGRLTTLSGALASWGGSATTAYLSGASYTALGQPLSRVYSNTITLGYSYHPTSYRLTALTAPGVNLGYGYDANGNVKAITDTNQATTFTYDDLDRLKTASGGYTASYSYQPNGNLTVKTEGGVTVTLSYPAGTQLRPHTPVSVNGQAYTYNANGSLEVRPGQGFGYDAENRLTQIVSGTITTTFTYDGDGNLVKKVTPEGTTLYVGTHYEVRPLPVSPLPVPQPPPTLPKRIFFPLVANDALFVDGRPAQPVKYYLVGGQRIASRAGSVGVVTYYYHDHLGSTIASSGGESTRY